MDDYSDATLYFTSQKLLRIKNLFWTSTLNNLTMKFSLYSQVTSLAVHYHTFHFSSMSILSCCAEYNPSIPLCILSQLPLQKDLVSMNAYELDPAGAATEITAPT